MHSILTWMRASWNLMNLLPRVCRMGSLRHLLPSGFLLEARGMKLRPVTCTGLAQACATPALVTTDPMHAVCRVQLQELCWVSEHVHSCCGCCCWQVAGKPGRSFFQGNLVVCALPYLLVDFSVAVLVKVG